MHRTSPPPRAPVAVVTGSRQGIGHAIAEALAVAEVDRLPVDIAHDEAAAQAIRDRPQPKRRAAFLTADIADIEAPVRLANLLFDTYGAVDCLVHNAGVQVPGARRSARRHAGAFRPRDELQSAWHLLTQTVACRMSQQTAVPGVHRGIVTISSANACLAAPDRPEYRMSRLSLSMMTRLFARRLGEAGICTHEIRPGIIRTRMTPPITEKDDRLIAGGLTPVARWGEPADVAGCV